MDGWDGWTGVSAGLSWWWVDAKVLVVVDQEVEVEVVPSGGAARKVPSEHSHRREGRTCLPCLPPSIPAVTCLAGPGSPDDEGAWPASQGA